MRFPPEHGLDFAKIPIWLNLRRTKFLIRFRRLLIDYYSDLAITHRAKYKQDELREQIRALKLEAERFVILGAEPGFNAAFKHGPTGQWFELFKIAENLHPYATALPVLLKRIDETVDLYRSDRPSAFTRTLNPQKMIRWAYSSMGEMPEWHVQHWMRQTWIGFLKLSRNIFAIIGLVSIVSSILSGVIDVGSFLGHRNTLERAVHKVARWFHLEKREHRRLSE